MSHPVSVRCVFSWLTGRFGPVLAFAIAISLALAIPRDASSATDPMPAKDPGSTADHSKFEALQKPFATGPEVTAACLTCHTEASKQLHKTTHWTWAFDNPMTGQQLGKKNVINNFCVATSTNWPRCTSCHIGYGWKDDNFDFASEKNVDCLVCHDTTGTYKKYPAGAGHPAYKPKKFPPKVGKLFAPPDLMKVAQSVGNPTRQNCGTCHFFGGGGNGVKHGDLDSSLFAPRKTVDVHMGIDGLNFTCQTCHSTGSHEVAGSRYVTKAVDTVGVDVPGRGDQSRATCESCHGLRPHPEDSTHVKLNDHTDRIACPTCHVPEFARGGRKTKTWWDWSTAGGKGPNGKKVEKDKDGYATHHFKKGTFRWEKNVVPEYRWFDGEIKYTLLGEKINPKGVVPINVVKGDASDPNSRIWPFKVMRGKQPYDKVNRILAVPHLFGKDDTAFWKNFDWKKAIATGLMAKHQQFSGEYGFVETEYFWPITHMVAEKEDALMCDDCHARDGRLAGVEGFYMPGRDRWEWLDQLGWILAGLSLAAVLGHGLIRIVLSGNRS